MLHRRVGGRAAGDVPASLKRLDLARGKVPESFSMIYSFTQELLLLRSVRLGAGTWERCHHET